MHIILNVHDHKMASFQYYTGKQIINRKNNKQKGKILNINRNHENQLFYGLQNEEFFFTMASKVHHISLMRGGRAVHIHTKQEKKNKKKLNINEEKSITA